MLNPLSSRSVALRNAVTVTLCGGLGNQLFQYATARAVAIRCNADLVLDLSWFDEVLSSPNVTPRKYALAPFCLPVHLARASSVTGAKIPLLERVFHRLGDWFGLELVGRRFTEESFRFDKRVLGLQAPVWLSGYWQSPHYFSDVAPQIREEIGALRGLSDSCVDLLQKIRATDSICVHVRRGDYVTNKEAASFHGLCSLDYYRNGVRRVADGLDSPHGFVFSDDPVWAKDNLKLDIEFTVVDVNGTEEPHFDLWLMAACKHFVIANSSLSWWGAWLASSSGKIVIAPARWFAKSTMDTSDLFPSDWMRV